MGLFSKLFGSKEKPNDHGAIEGQLHAITNGLVGELISLTPEFMNEIQFEIVATADGGADIGLLENHPEVKNVALSDLIYESAGVYLPVVKQYIPGWSRTLITITNSGDGWKVDAKFETVPTNT